MLTETDKQIRVLHSTCGTLKFYSSKHLSLDMVTLKLTVNDL